MDASGASAEVASQWLDGVNDSDLIKELEVSSLSTEAVDPDSDLLSTLSIVLTLVMVLMCITGAIMNTLSLIIFTRPSFRNRSINILLAGLSASDLCLLVLAIPVFSLNQIEKLVPSFSMQVTGRILVYAYPVTLMAQTMSVWLLVLITIDRYLAVCHPFLVQIHCTVKRAKCMTFCTFLFAVGYNFVRFWEYDINDSDDASRDNIIVGLLRNNYWYMLLYQNILNHLTQFVLPLLALSLLNLQVARAILKAGEARRELVASEKREHNTAKMMLFIVIVFLFCYILSFALNILEIFKAHLFQSQFGYLLNDINNILVVINSSSSFIFYTKYSSRYRNQLRTMYGIRYITSRFCFSDRFTMNGKARSDEYMTLSGYSTRQTMYFTTGSGNARLSAYSNKC